MVFPLHFNEREKGERERQNIASSKWIYVTIKTHQKCYFCSILMNRHGFIFAKIDKNKKNKKKQPLPNLCAGALQVVA